MHLLGIAIGIVDIPILLYLGNLLFGGWDGFFEALIFLFKPDRWSLFQGEIQDDNWATIKLIVYAIIVWAVIWAERDLVRRFAGD